MLYTKYYQKEKPVTLNDYFEKIFYINLDRRGDRLAQMVSQLEEHKIVAERFPAVDGNLIEKPTRLLPGEVGCLRSHKAVIQKAADAGYRNILIIEDDCVFVEEMQRKFAEYLPQLHPHWDFVYFGGNHGLSTADGKRGFRCNTHMLRLQFTLTTNCYGLSKKAYQTILDTLQPEEKQVDAYYADLHSKTRAYCFWPHLAWQRAGYSDIQCAQMDYEYLR